MIENLIKNFRSLLFPAMPAPNIFLR